MADKVYKAKQLRRVIQLLANLLTDESQMMEIADIYPVWQPSDYKYKKDDIIRYGVNDDGEAQLYIVLKTHKTTPSVTPDSNPTLYKKVGFGENGIPIWTQPISNKDAYNKGDIVYHEGAVWESDKNNNKNEPGVSGWHEVE